MSQFGRARRLTLLGVLGALSISAHAEPLSRGELGAELAYTALHVIDWHQTRQIAASDGVFKEKNVLLGPSPHRDKVDAYFAATLLGHWAVTYALPHEYRPYWLGSTITLEVAVIHHNTRIGLSWRF